MLVFGARIKIFRCWIVCLLTGLFLNAGVCVKARTLDEYLIASTAHSLTGSWLEDYLPEDYNEDVLQYFQGFMWDICPPVADEIGPESCHVTPCTIERKCENGQLCCSNGCVFTCLDKIERPAVIDWLREPKRRDGETAWLLPGDDIKQPIPECSTSKFPGSNDMLCPKGFKCKIENKGIAAQDMPNWGICVAHKVQPKEMELTVYEGESEGKKVILTGCQVNKKLYKDNDWFKYEKHMCKCSKGSVLCNVRNKRKHRKKQKV